MRRYESQTRQFNEERHANSELRTRIRDLERSVAAYADNEQARVDIEENPNAQRSDCPICFCPKVLTDFVIGPNCGHGICRNCSTKLEEQRVIVN